MIRAGELNKQITFQRKTVSYDSVNQPIETWSDSATVWASIKTTGGKEFYAAQKLNAETSALFKIRYTKAVNEMMRIRWGSRVFQILPPINNVDGKNTELHISAKEVV